MLGHQENLFSWIRVYLNCFSGRGSWVLRCCWCHRNTFWLLARTIGKKMFVGELVAEHTSVFFCSRTGTANRFLSSLVIRLIVASWNVILKRTMRKGAVFCSIAIKGRNMACLPWICWSQRNTSDCVELNTQLQISRVVKAIVISCNKGQFRCWLWHSWATSPKTQVPSTFPISHPQPTCLRPLGHERAPASQSIRSSRKSIRTRGQTVPSLGPFFKIMENILRILQQTSYYVSLAGFASFAYS